MQTKGESLELPVYTELRPPGGATTNSVYTKTFRIKQAFICSLSKMQLDLKRFSSLLYNFLPINRKLILQYMAYMVLIKHRAMAAYQDCHELYKLY